MSDLLIKIIRNDEGLYDGDLRSYFKIVFEAPNVGNPYHNFRHMMHVMCASYEGGKYEKIGKREMRNLLVAALFHDFGHSDKMGNDEAEIAKSVEALRNNITEGDKLFAFEIEQLIQATKWPHDESISVSETAKIIRDADMSQSLDGVWWQQIIFGLSQEQNISPIENLRNQIPFLSRLHFQSVWGNDVLQKKINPRIEEIKEYLKIMS